MNMATIQETILLYAPKTLATLAGVAFAFLLLKYKRKHDASAWLRTIYASAAKAAKNERYRQDELTDVNAELAKLPSPDPIVPLTNRQQIRYTAFPKMLFMTGLTAAVFLYMNFVGGVPPDMGWVGYAGWGFLVLTGVLYVLTEASRPRFMRVQQLNRKYLLQKAGTDAGRFDTLREILQYYAHIPELWVELGDQYAVDKRYDEAVDALQKARALTPEKIDSAILEVSFHIRRGDADAAIHVLDEAEQLKRIASDPRIAIYRGAAALLKNEKKTALRHGREAMELDSDFTERLVKNDSALEGVGALWEELFRKKDAEIFDAVAARQEARKAEETQDGEGETNG